MNDPSSTLTWRQLIAVGLIAGSLDARAIARYGGVEPSLADAALDTARRRGLLIDGTVAEPAASVLIAELPSDRAAEVHAAVARYLMTEGSQNVERAVEHAHAAGRLLPLEELVEAADHRGATSLSLGNYADARLLLQLAEDLDLAPDHAHHAQRLIDLGVAHRGLAQLTTARQLFLRAFDLAVHGGDTELAVRAAVESAFPHDWIAGEAATLAVLHQATGLDLDERQSVLITAARAAVEMRIPLPGSQAQQVAWITRASVAQPLAQNALDRSATLDPYVRCTALIAWRTTHRAPQFLDRRREYSAEALDLAQYLRLPGWQLGAAATLSVDAIESGDRPLFDRALTVARWVADREQSPYLKWYATTLAAGAALLDGDLEGVEAHRRAAQAIGEPHDIPGWLAADRFLSGALLIEENDPRIMAAALEVDDALLANPFAKAGVAYLAARLGRREEAERLVRQAIRQLDPEASMLLLASRAAAAALELDLDDVIDELITVLTPWSQHVAVDSNAWWCDGPVGLRLAELLERRGQLDEAARLLDDATATVRAMNDTRGLVRVKSLESRLAGRRTSAPPSSATDSAIMARLTLREREVLALMASGLTNPQIADELSYSLSTIRLDSMSIYRKLGVRGRIEAVALLLEHS